jgi:hypothetical protein
MTSDAMEVVNRWRAANFERQAVEDVLAEDVEWVVPKGGGVATLRGIDAVLGWYEAGGAADEAVPEDLGARKVSTSRKSGASWRISARAESARSIE